jgi:sugar-specific transcriptional regulator TrmB
MEDLSSKLQHFGFSAEESVIYLSVLERGEASVSQIAAKVGKHRTAAYFHIKKLLDKGVLKQTLHGRAMRLTAIRPNELGILFDQWTTDFKSVIPQLEALKKIDQEKPVIEVTESKRGYFKIYDEISAMPEGSTFHVAEGVTALQQELSLLTEDQWHTFFSRIVQRKIVTKGLFTEESIKEPSKQLSAENMKILRQRIWQVRTLPAPIFPLDQLVFIYGTKVAFLFPDVSLVMTIQHKGIAQATAAMFDAAYASGKQYHAAWE